MVGDCWARAGPCDLRWWYLPQRRAPDGASRPWPSLARCPGLRSGPHQYSPGDRPQSPVPETRQYGRSRR